MTVDWLESLGKCSLPFWGSECPGAQPYDRTGTGELVSTPGGIQSVSVMRFMHELSQSMREKHVEWHSSDVTGHTITFGQDPPDGHAPDTTSANVFVDPDGARHAIINSTTDSGALRVHCPSRARTHRSSAAPPGVNPISA